MHDGDLPAGLLTFLFTDIEGSTPRWEANPAAMRQALAEHDDLLASAIRANEGRVFKHLGDGVGAVFTSPSRAADAAIGIQRAVQGHDWSVLQSSGGGLRVRVGLHVGESEPDRGDYVGPAVNRAARVTDVANGDQIVVSAASATLLDGFELRPEGTHLLRGIGSEPVFRLHADGLRPDDRPLRAPIGPPAANLPVPAHAILGRDDEIATVAGLLHDHSVVTVSGPGGVGKTRLSIAVGRAVSDRFPDGLAMCELSAVADPASVAETVAEAIGARAQPGLSLEDSIVHFLERRRMLLVLDSCEHVVDTVRQLLERVRSLDGPVVLATSREPLGVDGEQLYGLAPLDPSGAAVALFRERAAERDPTFDPGEGGDDLVAAICEKVDGIPLAVELAAAWVRLLSLPQLLEQLDDRFRILRGGRHGGRHETLRDTVRWSYESLDDREAALFARLSVFAGGFTLDAVRSVCVDASLDADPIADEDVLDVLLALADKSMVVADRGLDRVRFVTLDTLRQFGQEQLDRREESGRFRRRHADYFGALAERQRGRLLTADEADAWDVLGKEWANIRTALDTEAVDGDIDAAIRIVTAVGWFATFSMRFEAFSWAVELLDRVDHDHPRRAALLGLRAMRAYFTVDDDAAALAEAGLALDPVDADGFCRSSLAAVYLNNLHAAAESAALTEGWITHLEDASPENRLWAEAFRVFHLASHDPGPEADDRAEALLREARATGSATRLALAQWARGLVAAVGDRDEAIGIWDDGLDAARSVSARHLCVHLLIGLQLHFAAGRGELTDTLRRCRDTLQLAFDQHYLVGTSHLFGVTAIVLARAGRAETGAVLLGAMQANGHLPRPNAVRAVARELGDDATPYAAEGARLAVNEAAARAFVALDEALAELDDAV